MVIHAVIQNLEYEEDTLIRQRKPLQDDYQIYKNISASSTTSNLNAATGLQKIKPQLPKQSPTQSNNLRKYA